MTKLNYKSQNISPYLLSSRPLIVLPELAQMLGLNEAIFLQQLHYLVSAKKETSDMTEYRKGRIWVFNKLEEWLENYFIFWSKSTLQRTITKLVNEKIVLKDKFNKSKSDQKLWYTIDYEKLNEYLAEKHDELMNKAIKASGE